MSNQKRYRAFGLYIAVIIILALLWIMRDSSSGFGQNSVYTYAQFEQDLEMDHVVSVVISQNREVPSGEADVTLKGESSTGDARGELADLDTAHADFIWRAVCILYYDDQPCCGLLRRREQDDEFWEEPRQNVYR